MRAFSFVILTLIGLLSPLPVFLFFILLYVFLWNGYELLMIGIFVDSVFGTSVTSFTYTLSIGAVLIFFTLIRPWLSWYTTRV